MNLAMTGLISLAIDTTKMKALNCTGDLLLAHWGNTG